MLDTRTCHLGEYTKAGIQPINNQAGRPITLEGELFTHITLGHLDPFWMDRQGIARVDLGIWKENKLPVNGIIGISEVIYGRLEEPDTTISKRIADSGVTMTEGDYRAYLVKNLLYIKEQFPDVKIKWGRVSRAFPAANGIGLNLDVDDKDRPHRYARSERDLFLVEE